MNAQESNEWFEKNKRKKKPVGEHGVTPLAEPINTIEVACYDAGQSSIEPGNLANSIALPSLSPGDLPTIAPAKTTPAPKAEEIALSARTPDELLKMEFDPGDICGE